MNDVEFIKEVRTVSSTGGEKGSKPWRYDLLPPVAVTQLAKLYGIGARKYAEHNFRKGYGWEKTFSALQRHANLFWSGEDYDLELEGVNHLISVAWHAVALTEFYYAKPQYDNREAPTRGEGDVSVGLPPVGGFKASHRDLRVGEGVRVDAEPRFDLIPLKPLALLSEFYGKYHDSSVRTSPPLWSSFYARIQEHAQRLWGGEDFDEATGFLHPVVMLYYTFEFVYAFENSKSCDNRLIVGAAPIGFDSSPE